MFTCENGFQRVGLPTVECGYTGQWIGLPPVCEPVQCLPPPVPDLTFLASLNATFQGKALFKCTQGFTAETPLFQICLATGNWSVLPGNCSGNAFITHYDLA